MISSSTEHLADRATRMGILVNLGIPALTVAVAVLLREGHLLGLPEAMPEFLQPLFYILGGVALMELAAAYLLRRLFFSPARVAPFCHDPNQIELWVVRSSFVIFAMGASPIVYGVVVYLIGGDLRQLAFFGLLTLLAYRLLRPTGDLIDETLESAQKL
ncbi:MAG: hypothetical protein HZB43_05690 [candidate division Zixibacteria bacterium]|nr:hypothetical protein [candidate division Zixibacteria bacterium]